MPPFRTDVLAEVTDVCGRLFARSRAVVEQQAHVSDKAKQDVVLLIVALDRLRTADPFPADTTDLTPLSDLRTRLDDADEDPAAVQTALMEWVTGFVPAPPTAADPAAADATPVAAPGPAVSPLNQRMIDLLFAFRRAIDQARRRLTRDRDRFDLSAYTSARNAFTLARAVYEERLRLGQVDATNAQCATMENELLPALATTAGAGFPEAIRAGADFIDQQIFA